MSDASEVSLPPAPSHQFRDPSRRFLWIVIALLVVILAAVFSARPVLRWFRTERAHGLVAEAEKARGKGDWEAVGRAVQVVLRLAPHDPGVLRLVARYCAHYRAPSGMDYWSFLATTPELTRQDRLEWATAALELGREADATTQLAALAKENENDPELQRLTIRLLLLRHDRAGALLVAREAVRRNAQDSGPQIALGSMLLEDPDPARRAEGRGILWNLAQRAGDEQIEAIKLYASSPELSPAEIRAVLALIGQQKGASLGRQLALQDLHWRLDVSAHDELRQAVRALALPNSPPTDTARVAEWLNAHGEFAAALEVIPRANIKTATPLALWHLVALAGLQRWDEFQSALGDPATALEPFRRECLRALASDAQGRPSEGHELRMAAIASCRGDPAQLLDLIGYAERAGDARAALAAHTVLLNFPPLALKSAAEILRLVELTGEPAGAIPAIRRVLEFQPDNAAALNGLAYLLALTGRSDPKLTERVQKLQAANPANVGYRVTLALTELRKNNAEAALGLLEGQGLESPNAPLRWRVVYAACLMANRQDSLARRVMAQFDQAQLVAEEAELLRNRW
jgi:predicted Zn-dependent protease